MKKRTLLTIGATASALFLILGIVLYLLISRRDSVEYVEVEKTDTSAQVLRYSFCADNYQIVDTTYPAGVVFGTFLGQLGVDANTVNQWVEHSEGVLDLRKLRAGNPCVIFRTKEEEKELKHFVYHIDRINYVIFSNDTANVVKKGSLPVDTAVQQYTNTITSSLWNAMVADGKSPELILSLSDIFAWVIDFYGIQKGDMFKVFYDELSVEGKSIGIGSVYGAWFVNDGKEFYAFRYEQDGKMLYFDELGNSLRREFLKAPLEFRRISSHFSHSRFHPILRRYRAHHGVDYAAAAGTPVRTIGDGTVLEARYAGGGGNTVKIRHNSVYTTVYMHLRGYGKGIKPGVKVKQGDVIGYVGSTGLSTGPHLDFRVYKNGTPINPLKLESPPAEPIEPEKMEQYKEDIKSLKIKLDAMKTKPLEED